MMTSLIYALKLTCRWYSVVSVSSAFTNFISVYDKVGLTESVVEVLTLRVLVACINFLSHCRLTKSCSVQNILLII